MQNRTLLLIIIIISLAVGFTGGLHYEKLNAPENTPAGNSILLNRGGEKPEGVDFSLFWDAYNLLKEKYVDRNELDDQELLFGAIKGLVESVGDPYTLFLKPKETKNFTQAIDGKFGGVGIEIGIRKKLLTVIAPLEGTPAEKAGLLAGDKIIAVDDTSTEGMPLYKAVELIRGERKTPVTLTIFREGVNEPFDVTVIRDTIKIPAVRVEIVDNGKYGISKDKRIAHLKLYTFNRNVDRQFQDAADKIIRNGANGIILDLRNNPGGLLDSSVNIASYFMEPEKTVVIERFGDGSENVFKTSRNAKLKDIPVIVLVNKGSASASEILAGALRDQSGATVVGETSFGKGSVQQLEDLKYGTSLKITIAKWLTPDGTSINEDGIKPDIEIKRTKDDIENDKDPQLEKAIEMFNNM